MLRLLKISVFVLSVGLCGLIFPYQAGAITIFIDGMNRGTTWDDLSNWSGGPAERDAYLMNSELGKELRKKDGKQEQLEWNGDVAGEKLTNVTAERLYERIKEIKNNPKTNNEQINIVSHSYGSVIAYNALDKLNNDASTKNIKIDTFTTMGSPLGRQNFLDPKGLVFKAHDLNNVKQWTNLWADNDNISGKINVNSGRVNNIQIDKDVNNKKDVIYGENKDLFWHKAYYTPIDNLKVKSTGEVINWNIPKDYANALMSGRIESFKSFKGVISLQDSVKGEANEQQASGHKEGDKANLARYESMSKKDLRKELEQKMGHKLDDDYDKKSKRELISELTGVPKEQIHASVNDPQKPEKQAEPKGKSLDQYEKMSKGDLRKELEKKTGEKGKYDKLSSRELISALTGAPKDQIHVSKEKDKKDQAKDLDQYENVSKKELRKELEKETGKSDKFDKMSKRELVSALTGIPKDKIDLDKKEKDQTKKKDDDRQKKDGGAVTKLSKAQAEEIWKARPDVNENVHAKKKGDPYEKTQTWWEKYGQKEMGSNQFAGTTPAATPAASPTPSPSPPTPSPIKKLSKAQAEEIWKTRPDVNENVHAKKKGDPYEKTQAWWENNGRKEMGNYQFAGTSPPAAPVATPPTVPPAKIPVTKLSKAQAEPEEKRRKQEEGRAEQERQKQAKLEEQRRRDEAKRLQEAKNREEQAKTGEKLKAQQEEKRRQEAQRRVEQERQRQAKADEQRRREEQQHRAREQAQQRQAQMEQQRRAEDQRRQEAEQRQRAQQEQLQRQQEQQQRVQMEQQRRQQAEQQQRLQFEQQRQQQQEEARRRQAQMQQQRQMQQQPAPPQPGQQRQPQQQPKKQKQQQL